jgi:hypothetical protein
VRRGQHFRVSLEIANEMPAEKSKQLLTLNRFRREHWARSTPPINSWSREQFAVLEQIEEAKAPGLLPKIPS